MDDFSSIRNIDEYTGFIYGMLSSNHDIEAIFIDGILKQANITSENIPRFIDRIYRISEVHNVEFYVSLSADKEELNILKTHKCNFLN